MILGLIFIFGLVLGMLLIAFEDGSPFSLWFKLKCKLGFHKIRTGFGRKKINKYYCQKCKKPRNHPHLKVIEGNGLSKDRFKF